MQLEFSKYDFRFKDDNRGRFIFDIIRKKYILLTPEEWVRQHIVHYLINDYKHPKALISVEKQLVLNELSKRTDIVLYNYSAKPVMLIECKSPSVKLSQKTFEQIARYNLSLNVPYLVISNGNKNYCCFIDHAEKSFHFIDAMPSMDVLMK